MLQVILDIIMYGMKNGFSVQYNKALLYLFIFKKICTTFLGKDVGKLPFASPDNSFLQIPSMTVSSGMSGWSISEKGKLKRRWPKKPLSAKKRDCVVCLLARL